MRNHETDHLIRNEVTPGCEWVINGEGIATRKWDGTCCLVSARGFFKRYEVKTGKYPPVDFEVINVPDPVTGNIIGWVPVSEYDPADKWYREAYGRMKVYFNGAIPPGTYELVGPKINGNKDKYPEHILARHGASIHDEAPRTFEALRRYLGENSLEGLVWHHTDGRMCKIKARDFDIKW